jgi:hypothetical protein
MAATKKKKVDPIKQREKRAKIAAAVGVVLLLAVGAYEIPSMLAVMNKKPPPGSTYDPGPSTSVGGLPNVSGQPTTGAPASSGELVNSDVPPTSTAGQLVSFSVFETKNPFAPQVTDKPSSSTPTGSSTTASTPGADVPAGGTTTTPTSTVPTATTPGAGVVPPAPATTLPTTTTTTTTPPVATAPTVALSVNGVVSHVATQGTFPSGSPVFRLIAWTKDTASIGIVGGSYATGDATLTLHLGQPVTLENQTDGKRYKLELLSTS